MMKVLHIFATRMWPMRSSQYTHISSFKKYIPNSKVFWVNLGMGDLPIFIKYLEFDLIIFDWSFVGQRTDRDFFIKIVDKLSFLRECKGTKIALPQDEFTSMDLLNQFIIDFNISHVFSVAPESEWKKIYPNIDLNKTKFHRILTGYLDESSIHNLSRLNSIDNRRFDIGYRTVSTASWGRFNLMKATLARVFTEKSFQYKLNCDIKVGEKYFHLGKKWFEFLSDCKYTLGIEGGSRILDWDGSIWMLVNESQRNNKLSSSEDLADSFVPLNREGEINVVAISPRHLEACITKTVQILVEGDYNNILLPNIHYIPLKEDLSNVDDILILLSDDVNRKRIADNAYNDIVKSGKYTYNAFIDLLLKNIDLRIEHPKSWHLKTSIFYYVNQSYNHINLSIVWLLSRLRDVRNFLF